MSTAYYAGFHALAQCIADTVIGGTGANRSEPAWAQSYRALEHRPAKEACRNIGIMARFPQPIRDFANVFVMMQEKRHKADYDPTGNYARSTVLIDIDAMENAIRDFQRAAAKDKRAFCAHVLFKKRT